MLSPWQSPCCPRLISRGFKEYKDSPPALLPQAPPLLLHFTLQGNSFFVMTNFLKSEGQEQKLCPEVSRGHSLSGQGGGAFWERALYLPQSKGLCEYLLLPSQAFCAAHNMIPGLYVIYLTFHWSLHGVLPAWGPPQDPGEGSLAYTAVWPGSFHLALCPPLFACQYPPRYL